MELLARYRAPVLHEIDRLVGGPPSPVLTMCRYHLGLSDEEGRPANGSPGKMLRSSLCLAMCAALGGDVRRCLPVAVSVELMHRTSLVFDDIQDRSSMRNGRPTVWDVWGDAQAINAGLALSCYSRLALVESDIPQKARIQGHLEQAVLDLCRGQQMDISFRDTPPTPQAYTEMVLRKTGILLGAACKVGAMVADQPDATWARASLFGDALGVAFQYQDDYLGVWGDAQELGKEPDDLAQRRCGVPVVLAMDADPPFRALFCGRHPLDDKATAMLQERLDNLGMKQISRTAVLRAGGSAVEQLRRLALPASWEAAFAGLVDFAVKRTS